MGMDEEEMEIRRRKKSALLTSALQQSALLAGHRSLRVTQATSGKRRPPSYGSAEIGRSTIGGAIWQGSRFGCPHMARTLLVESKNISIYIPNLALPPCATSGEAPIGQLATERDPTDTLQVRLTYAL